MQVQEKIVISLGGSLIVPNEIDINFVHKFKNLIEKQVELGKQFFLVVGGGKVCRKYQSAARELGVTSEEDLDWIGIYSTHLNACFIQKVFGEYAHETLLLRKDSLTETNASIVVGAGWEPGSSTDYDTIELARFVGAKKALNLSNIDHVYTDDPRKNPQAEKVDNITWKEYRSLIPRDWNPGLNTPFDPVAAEAAEEAALEIAVMNGSDISNIEKYLNGDTFEGTLIHP